jgi:hypothetical protein
MVFPGAVLATVLLRPSKTIPTLTGIDIALSHLFLLQTIVLGWLFPILDMPIYMLFEGRRFWPSFLLRFGRKRERSRLYRIYRRMRRYDLDRIVPRPGQLDGLEVNRRYLEAAVELSNFPLDPTTTAPRAIWPTRLGNLIAAYEQYPRLKYGLDAVFFWPRLWTSISKDLREEIDNQQAQVDGTLYVVVALYCSSLVLLAYAVTDAYTDWLAYRMPPILNVAAALLCVGAAFVLYRASLHLHAQFGEYFKSVFDQSRSLIDVKEVVKVVASLTNDRQLKQKDSISRNVAAWRFLRWHRVRFPGERRNRRARP